MRKIYCSEFLENRKSDTENYKLLIYLAMETAFFFCYLANKLKIYSQLLYP